MRYEKPELVALSQKAFGDAQQGDCVNGSSAIVVAAAGQRSGCQSGFNASP